MKQNWTNGKPFWCRFHRHILKLQAVFASAKLGGWINSLIHTSTQRKMIKENKCHRSYFHTFCNSSPLDSMSSRIGQRYISPLEQITVFSCVHFLKVYSASDAEQQHIVKKRGWYNHCWLIHRETLRYSSTLLHESMPSPYMCKFLRLREGRG